MKITCVIITLGDKMKKILFLMTLIIGLALPFVVGAASIEAIPSPQVLTLNGVKQELQGYNINGYNYFKLRDLAAILKPTEIKFSLVGDHLEIKANFNEEYLQLATDLAKLSGTKKEAIAKSMNLMTVKGVISDRTKVNVYNIDGFNYFRLREIGALFGFEVDYDEAKNEAQINTKVSVVTPTNPITGRVVLGNERLLEEYSGLLNGKKLGLVTNQTGIDGNGTRTVDKLYTYKNASLVAIYSPEHGLDGLHKAGAYVESYTDEKLNLPVYSLYGKTREPSKEMLKGIDVLIFDIQDIGSRTYTYISTLNYVMKAAAKYDIPVIVLDRPNPLGGEIVEGYMLEEKYKTFVGVDIMPMAHGMTVGEIANYFNRNIKSKLTVIPMKNYTRSMIWQDTGLTFAQTSPNIPDITAAFNYMATGIGDGTGIGMSDKFNWVGGLGINSNEFARIMNAYNLPGISFTAETIGEKGGIRLKITDFKTYNPARTGIYIMSTANLLTNITVPVEKDGVIPMFEKIMGTNRMGLALLAKRSPEQIVAEYQSDVGVFKSIRQNYLIYK